MITLPILTPIRRRVNIGLYPSLWAESLENILFYGTLYAFNQQKEFQSRCDLLEYFSFKNSFIIQKTSDSLKDDFFHQSFKTVGEYFLKNFFQHSKSDFQDYKLSFFIKDDYTKKLIFFAGITSTHLGQQPKNNPKRSSSLAYRGYHENRIYRCPQDIKKKNLKPKLTRDIASFACIPVSFTDKTNIGVLIIESFKRKDQFDDSDKFHILLLEDFAEFLTCIYKKCYVN